MSCSGDFKNQLVEHSVVESVCTSAETYYYESNTGKEVFSVKQMTLCRRNADVSNAVYFGEITGKQRSRANILKPVQKCFELKDLGL